MNKAKKVLLEIRGIIDLSDDFTKTERLEQTKTYIFNKLNEMEAENKEVEIEGEAK